MSTPLARVAPLDRPRMSTTLGRVVPKDRYSTSTPPAIGAHHGRDKQSLPYTHGVCHRPSRTSPPLSGVSSAATVTASVTMYIVFTRFRVFLVCSRCRPRRVSRPLGLADALFRYSMSPLHAHGECCRRSGASQPVLSHALVFAGATSASIYISSYPGESLSRPLLHCGGKAHYFAAYRDNYLASHYSTLLSPTLLSLPSPLFLATLLSLPAFLSSATLLTLTSLLYSQVPFHEGPSDGSFVVHTRGCGHAGWPRYSPRQCARESYVPSPLPGSSIDGTSIVPPMSLHAVA